MIALSNAKKTAISKCEWLQNAITEWEFQNGKLCHLKRAELAAWRRLLVGSGVPHEDIPSMPPIDPAIHEYKR